MTLLETHNLALKFSGRAVLHDVNLEISRGEIVTIVGPNGSGKTSLVRALIGAVPPNSGTIKKADGLKIGYVPQRLDIDATMPLTVSRFLALAAQDDAETVDSILTRVGAPGIGERQVFDLSGGQRQRVLLARALMGRPDLLILDEATAGLDQPATASFYRLIETLRRTMECAVLMVSHDLHVVMSASDRVICLNGHICCEGTPTTVSSAPEYRALFGLGTEGALALYQHEHDHAHDECGAHEH